MSGASLYQRAILDLARAADGAGRLPSPQAAATVDNPLCGDRVTVELALEDGVVSAFAHRVRGCVLCEAAAAAIGRHAVGASAAALREAAAAAEAMIRDGGAVPEGWPDLAVFTPVRSVKSRHDCVLLPFQALARALGEAAPTAGVQG